MNKNNPLVSFFGSVLTKAVEAAAEVVLDEAQDKIDLLTERVSKAKKRVKSRKSKDAEIIEVEVISKNDL